MKDIDVAHKDFLTFQKDFELLKDSNLTESDTRSKLIDYLFISVLGWEEKNINREGYVKEGYYDYLFSIPGFQFLVEAKKNFVEFTLPQKHHAVTLGTLEKGNKEVIKQVRSYLFEIGLQYGIITNGHQFIIGKFSNTDGTDWRKNKCAIFNGLDDVENRFIDFFNVLSKASLIENCGFKLSIDEVLPNGKKIISTIASKDAELIRNSLSANLLPILDDIFGELYSYDELTNKELIKECFIENKEIKKNKSEIEKLFADKPPKLEEIVQVRNTKNLSEQIQTEIDEYPIKKDIDAPKPIIIVGSKGAGKTTFINYLFKNNFNGDIHKEHPYVYIDFRDYSSKDFKDYQQNVISDILERIYEDYSDLKLHSKTALKRIYFKEIRRNDESIWQSDKESNPDKYNDKLDSFLENALKDNENHFYKLSEYLIRERRIRLCIIIDNVDQFDISIQKDVFLFSQSINRKGKVNVVLSLREGYYYKWRYQPPFDAFPPNVYHITAPPYNEVLHRRINYALKYLNVIGKSEGALKSGAKVQIDNESVKDFLLSLEKTLFSNTNSEMLKFIQETTYPNIREGLEIFKQFLISGHTEVDQYIIRQRTSPDSKIPIPFWEFVKAVALNNKMYYNKEISVVCNLFSPAEGSRNHFLKIKLLRYLDNRIVKGGQTEKFILINDLISTFSSAGYNLRIIVNELNLLSKYRLIETDDLISDIEINTELIENQSVAISLKGHYYVNVLKNKFSYLEMVLQDTQIFDDEYFAKIKEVFPLSNEHGKRQLDLRIETVKRFMEYLKNEEKKESIESETIAKGIVDEIYDTSLSHTLYRIAGKIKAPNNV
ncbi:AAA family ATPase [Marinifilum sp. D737]|uniref:AAA family ATPase n=1 Tax=Marinifilum sp. D737 TaxID=2969628 RepID=UPI002274B1B8|nr:AAA family ATPase [Marinifilum sp. D737]MCY1636708.1 AAA family ATPase [Marinifilum sp. D737]